MRQCGLQPLSLLWVPRVCDPAAPQERGPKALMSTGLSADGVSCVRRFFLAFYDGVSEDENLSSTDRHYVVISCC